MEKIINNLKNEYKMTENEEKMLQNVVMGEWDKEFSQNDSAQVNDLRKKIIWKNPFMKFAIIANLAVLFFVVIIITKPFKIGFPGDNYSSSSLTGNTSNNSTPQVTTMPNVMLQTGYNFYLPKDWYSRISNQTDNYFYSRMYLPDSDNQYNFIEVESSKDVLAENPILQFDQVKKYKVNSIDVNISSGKEDFLQSTLKVKSAEYQKDGTTFKATIHYQESNSNISAKFDNFVNTVTYGNVAVYKTPKRFTLINPVYAEFPGDPNWVDPTPKELPIPFEEFNNIKIMGDIVEKTFTDNDQKFMDEYAHLYKVEVVKGQRLHIFSIEVNNELGSYIGTALYNNEGKLIKSLDTSVEYVAQYSGIYYFIIYSPKLAEYKLKVFDRNQVENYFIIKYSDGAEVIIDGDDNPPKYGNREFVFIAQYMSPVTVENSIVAYHQRGVDLYRKDMGILNVGMSLVQYDETYEQFQIQRKSTGESVGLSVEKLSESSVLIKPFNNDSFPGGYHYYLNTYTIGQNSLGLNATRVFMFD